MKIVYLHPHSSFRTPLRSDTIFGLLIWSIREIFGLDKMQEILDQFIEHKPPFLLSSAMPFMEKEDEKICYFPKPLSRPMITDMTPELMDDYKSYKKLHWLTWDDYQKLRNGEVSEQDFYQAMDWKKQLSPSPVLTQVVHNSIDRLTNTTSGEGNLFYSEEYYPNKGGVFFLINILNNSYVDLFTGIFQFYSHVGFGGDASIGKGHFDFTIEDFPYDFSIADAKHLTNLSLYFPRKEETAEFVKNPHDLWYKMEIRKGKVGGRLFTVPDVWKKTVNVFKEGSCFPKISNHHFYGDVPVVKEKNQMSNFDVHYYGYALMVDYKKKESA